MSIDELSFLIIFESSVSHLTGACQPQKCIIRTVKRTLSFLTAHDCRKPIEVSHVLLEQFTPLRLVRSRIIHHLDYIRGVVDTRYNARRTHTRVRARARVCTYTHESVRRHASAVNASLHLTRVIRDSAVQRSRRGFMAVRCSTDRSSSPLAPPSTESP